MLKRWSSSYSQIAVIAVGASFITVRSLASIITTQESKLGLMPFTFCFDYSNSVAFDLVFADFAVRFLSLTRVVLVNLVAGFDSEKS